MDLKQKFYKLVNFSEVSVVSFHFCAETQSSLENGLYNFSFK